MEIPEAERRLVALRWRREDYGGLQGQGYEPGGGHVHDAEAQWALHERTLERTRLGGTWPVLPHATDEGIRIAFDGSWVIPTRLAFGRGPRLHARLGNGDALTCVGYALCIAEYGARSPECVEAWQRWRKAQRLPVVVPALDLRRTWLEQECVSNHRTELAPIIDAAERAWFPLMRAFGEALESQGLTNVTAA